MTENKPKTGIIPGVNVNSEVNLNPKNPLNSKERNPIIAISEYAQGSAADVLGDVFDASDWEKTMLRTKGTLEVGKPVSAQRAPYALGILRVAEILEEMNIEDPHALPYVITMTYNLAGRENRIRSSRSDVASGRLSQEQIEELRTTDEPTRRREILQTVIQENSESALTEQQERKRADRLTGYGILHKLDDVVPLLDSLAKIPLLQPSIQEDRIRTLFPDIPETEKRRNTRVTVPSQDKNSENPNSGSKVEIAMDYALSLTPGTFITAPKLAAATGVGKDAAKLALGKLAAEGKIHMVKGHGALILNEDIATFEHDGPKIREVMAYVSTLRPGTKITTKELATTCGVSYLPACYALQNLATLGKIVSKHNIGNFVTEDDSTIRVVGPQTKKAIDFIEGLPSGREITVRSVMPSVKVGKDTIWKALGILEGEGKITRLRNRGKNQEYLWCKIN